MKLRRLKSKALILFYALVFILVFRLSAPAQETVDPKIIEGAKKEGQSRLVYDHDPGAGQTGRGPVSGKVSVHQARALSHGRRSAAEQDPDRNPGRTACVGCGSRKSRNPPPAHAEETSRAVSLARKQK